MYRLSSVQWVRSHFFPVFPFCDAHRLHAEATDECCSKPSSQLGQPSVWGPHA
ncbi:hypothetical protein BDZ89DRAFT_1062186, partial [Hymenopellis radicata]